MRTPILILAFISMICTGAFASPIAPEDIYPDPTPLSVEAINNAILFVNGDGGSWTKGPDDPQNNVSETIKNAANIPPYQGTTEDWERVMDCLNYIFHPFDIVVTDQDPGSAPHLEAVVADSPTSVGFDGSVGGKAPLHCGGRNSAVTWNFTETSGLGGVCETIAQETAHALGLDHLLTCNDPMTYLPRCGQQTFQDTNANCGEDNPRMCSCGGGNTQNSYQHLLGLLGEGREDSGDPSLEIISPQPDEVVPVGFKLRARATDDLSVEKIEYYVNGQYYAEGRFGVVEVSTPLTIGHGEHQVEVVAIDVAGNRVSEEYSFVVTQSGQAPECLVQSDCAEWEICYKLECIDDPGPGVTGDVCETGTDCLSRRCKSLDGQALCTDSCDQFRPCPRGYACNTDEGDGFCWPAPEEDKSSGGGGCQSLVNSKLLFVIMIGGLFVLTRRRVA